MSEEGLSVGEGIWLGMPYVIEVHETRLSSRRPTGGPFQPLLLPDRQGADYTDLSQHLSINGSHPGDSYQLIRTSVSGT